MRRLFTGGLVALLCLAAATGRAQSLGAVSGVVRDASGAVLPGVTVEVANPSLLEKARTGLTDGIGRYTIDNLPAGTYTATFSLPGFYTVRREGIEVAADAVATVNAELKIWLIPQIVTGPPPAFRTSPLPSRTVVCGMTVIQGDSKIDPKMAQHLPAAAPKPNITIMPAPACGH